MGCPINILSIVKSQICMCPKLEQEVQKMVDGSLAKILPSQHWSRVYRVTPKFLLISLLYNTICVLYSDTPYPPPPPLLHKVNSSICCGKQNLQQNDANPAKMLKRIQDIYVSDTLNHQCGGGGGRLLTLTKKGGSWQPKSGVLSGQFS